MSYDANGALRTIRALSAQWVLHCAGIKVDDALPPDQLASLMMLTVQALDWHLSTTGCNELPDDWDFEARL